MKCDTCGACQAFILVVEDDAASRDALREHLEGLGCRVMVAVDGVDALERLRHSAQPCLILADLNMPRLDGVGLVRRVRADDGDESTPIVTMSAEPRRERPRHTEAHLQKPFTFADLDPVIARLCRGGPARHRVLGQHPA
jgi:CheY-like chemotaxis protein